MFIIEDDLVSEGVITEEGWRKIARYYNRGEYYRRLGEARQRGLRKRALKWSGWTEKERKE